MLRRFVIRTLLFSLPVAMLWLGLEWLQRVLPMDYKEKKATLERLAPELHTLVLGSSHTYLGVNPDLLDGPAYNMAMTAQTLYFDAFLLEKYIDSLPALRRVVLPVSYPSLGGESERYPGDYNKSYYYAFFYGSRAFTKPYSVRRYSLTAMLSIKKAVDRTWEYYMGIDDLIDFEPNGWYPSMRQKDLAENARNAGAFHDRYYDPALHSVNIGRLVHIIGLCQARDIELICVSMPMWEGYLEVVQAGRYQFMVSTMDSLAAVYGVPYFNYTRDTRFGAEDYYDSNHLRREGAEKFTRILQADIDALRAAPRAVALENS
ncbi:MAG: hypothetical protein OHK0039_01030 [Bacteroidia bacterium]